MGKQKKAASQRHKNLSDYLSIFDDKRKTDREYIGLIEAMEMQNQFLSEKCSYVPNLGCALDATQRITDLKMCNIVKKALAGSIIIDLGGGDGYGEHLLFDKLRVKASHYVLVDKYLPTGLGVNNPIGDFTVMDHASCVKRKPLSELFIEGDMLDFICRLKDNSANFCLNGIDDCIIQRDEYHHALVDELSRVTEAGGLVFGSCSVVLEMLHRKEQETNKYFKEHKNIYKSIHVFERRKRIYASVK